MGRNKKIYNIGKKLGLTEKDIITILYNNGLSKEKTVLTMGPYPYNSTHYGTISIKDF
jgi:hypothetical protein